MLDTQLPRRYQVSVQLRGEELACCFTALESGHIGLEIGDFASPTRLDSDWRATVSHYQKLASKWPGVLSMHGPFLDLSPTSPEPRLREITWQRYRQAIQIAGMLNAKYVVFHTQFNPNIGNPDYRENWVKGNAHFFTELLPHAEAVGTTLLLENLWDPSPEHIIRLLDSVGSPNLRACLDTGHTHIFSKLPLEAWVTKLGQRLAYIHFSDNHGTWDEHLAPGEGTIDFAPLFSAIGHHGLTPVLVLEVSRYSQALRGIQYLDSLL